MGLIFIEETKMRLAAMDELERIIWLKKFKNDLTELESSYAKKANTIYQNWVDTKDDDEKFYAGMAALGKKTARTTWEYSEEATASIKEIQAQDKKDHKATKKVSAMDFNKSPIFTIKLV